MIAEFWIPAVGLLLAVALVLVRALQVPPEQDLSESADQHVYRDQLAEVARDIAKGSLSAEEGARLRAEVARRLLEADRAGTSAPKAVPPMRKLAVGVTLALLGAGALTYTFVLGAPGYPDLPLSARIERAAAFYASRPTQDQQEAQIGPQGKMPADPAEAQLLLDLRAAVALRPDDLRGHEILAKTEAAIGNYPGARAAFERVIVLKGGQASAGDHAVLAEMMIAAAGGIVTPQAEGHLIAALVADTANPVARYYSGQMLAQIGRPDQAFALWRALLDQGPPDAPWIPAIRDQIEDLAQAAGVNYALPALPGADLAGPDVAAVDAAGQMSAEDRQAMIADMVGGLEERLLAEGGTAQEWARLVSSLGVLGESGRAEAALKTGSAALAGDEAGLAILNGGAPTP